MFDEDFSANVWLLKTSVEPYALDRACELTKSRSTVDTPRDTEL